MPKMKFPCDVFVDGQVYASKDQIKDVPKASVDRWKKRGASLVEDLERQELVQDLEKDVQNLVATEHLDPAMTITTPEVEVQPEMEVDPLASVDEVVANTSSKEDNKGKGKNQTKGK